MGNSLGNVLQAASASNNQRVSDVTREKVMELFYVLRANPKVKIDKIEGLLSIIPKNENILTLTDSTGYNLLQKTVSLNHIDIVKWLLSRSNVDINRGACSLPLHIACFKGYKEMVDILVNKHRARRDIESKMCWPGIHSVNCEERSKLYPSDDGLCGRLNLQRSSDKLQSAIYYAIDGDHSEILEMLMSENLVEREWLPWHQKRPLLHVAVERGAFQCTQFLIQTKSEEINAMSDDYFPIHHAVLHDVKFVSLLLQAGATATVRTATEMTVLHLLFLLGKKSADDALVMTKLLLDHGMRELINEPDSLGNTVLHTIIVRYALEESRFASLYSEYTPWTKWDFLHLVRFLLQQGAKPSINQPGNSVLACVLRHVRDWEFRYELLSMLLQEGGDPNIVGRDGSVPLMVCLVPLINKDLLHNFTHLTKVFYLNCVRILLKHGAQVNCCSRTHLTPLHVLMFAASEYMGLMQSEEKRQSFEFIRQLLEMLLSWDLDPNMALGGSRTQHILLSLLELVNLVRSPNDLDYVYDLTLTLIQHGANVDIDISMPESICHSQSSFYLKKSSNKVLYYYIQWLCRKEHLLLDPDQKFAKIIRLYAMCMSHKDLYSHLKLLHTQSAIVPVRTALCTTLKSLYSQPRSLAQICRIVIYHQLSRSPAKFANKLVLPPPLIKYLLSFD